MQQERGVAREAPPPRGDKLTNFGLNTGENSANVEGKLLGEGTVLSDGYSLPGIIEPLLHTGLPQSSRG